MLSDAGRRLFAEPLRRLAAWLQTTSLTPNALTFIGFLMTAISAFLLGSGFFGLGGFVLLIAAFFDMLDGTLARATNQSTLFGAFLDSTLDRYAESVTFLSLAFYYSSTLQNRTELILIVVILIGSLMVSYTRARAEALQVECKAGILQRPERVVLLILGLVSGWMLAILWILALFTHVTTIQRIYEVFWRTRPDQLAVASGKVSGSTDKRTV